MRYTALNDFRLTDEPTENQIKQLKEWGLTPPPTHSACLGIIHFIDLARLGTNTDQYMIERINRLRELQKQFIGKVVKRQRKTKIVGKVKYIYVTFSERGTPYKFVCCVETVRGVRKVMRTTSLSIVESCANDA